MDPISSQVLRELAPNGVLRAAINFGNPVLAQKRPASGEAFGVSVDLALELGRHLGVPVTLTPFDSASKVFEASNADGWDVAFLAIDPMRAAEILFTSPYVIIEGTYIVRDDSPFRRIEDFDRPGVRIAVGKGAAYDLFLTRTLNAAELVRAGTSGEAIERFASDGLDAAAGVRQTLLHYARTHPGFRVIDGRFTAIEQAMGTPRGRAAARRYLQSFIEAMKANGFVAAALKRSGHGDASIAPPA